LMPAFLIYKADCKMGISWIKFCGNARMSSFQGKRESSLVASQFIVCLAFGVWGCLFVVWGLLFIV
jgi:hypothetical protein